MTFGGHGKEDAALGAHAALAADHFGASGEVTTQSVCVDRGRQWSKAANVWHNAGIRSGMHMTGAPIRIVRPAVPAGRLTGCATRSSSARAPTASRPRSSWPAPAARCSCSSGAGESAAAPRTAELTLPGYRHDVCSAIHPLAVGSPFLRTLPLHEHGLELIEPAGAGGPPARRRPRRRAAPVARATAAALGGHDGAAYAALIRPFARDWDGLADFVLGAPRPPRHPLLAARFARVGAARSVGACARGLPLRAAPARSWRAWAPTRCGRSTPPTAAFALVLLALGHAVGWPVARGGSQAIADAMAAYLARSAARSETGRRGALAGRPAAARAVLLDVTPRQLLAICGDAAAAALPRRRWAATATAPACSRSTTPSRPRCRGRPRRAAGPARCTRRHAREIAAAESTVARGGHPERPFVLVAQQSLVDPTRAPAGSHTLWAYCHVPNGSAVDMTAAIEAQIERFAPGFRDVVLARVGARPRAARGREPQLRRRRHQRRPADLRQVLARPALRLIAYATPNPRLFLCSSSTPPGGGVHGMCGYHAARAALRGVLR